jgi:FKBP-type peptidyl-prolyl cis-trans isomerase FklB
MKKSVLIVLLSVLAWNLAAQKKVGKVKIENERDSVSYALGVSIATNLKAQNINEINPLAMAKALEDVYADKNVMMTPDQANEVIQKFFDKKESTKYQSTIDEGKKFLAENAKKEGVVTLPSGLQYKVIEPGTGKTPVATDKVKTHYRGTLIDGTVFDSSYDRGEPLVFGVTQVIKGWTEALMLMKEGAKWELYIPADLAYGSRDMGTIKPFSTLIFTVELISIEK